MPLDTEMILELFIPAHCSSDCSFGCVDVQRYTLNFFYRRQYRRVQGVLYVTKSSSTHPTCALKSYIPLKFSSSFSFTVVLCTRAAMKRYSSRQKKIQLVENFQYAAMRLGTYGWPVRSNVLRFVYGWPVRSTVLRFVYGRPVRSNVLRYLRVRSTQQFDIKIKWKKKWFQSTRLLINICKSILKWND